MAMSLLDSWTQIETIRDGGKLLGFIAIHRGNKQHPAFGATRIARYSSEHDALADALNLAYLMSHKAALAGIPYGGGKGVIIEGQRLRDPRERARILTLYARKVNELAGKFITGADAGVSQADVYFLKEHSPHIVGVSVDPSRHTAEGLVSALQVTAENLFGDPSLKDKSFAILGLGKVGGALLSLLAPHTKNIAIADIDPAQIERARDLFPHVRVIAPDIIHKESVDFFMPCAFGGIINTQTARDIQAKAIVGSANNQLASEEAGDILHARRICYAPDYVANAGGLISVAREFEAKDNAHHSERVCSQIRDRLVYIYQESERSSLPTHRIANNAAMLRINELFAEQLSL